MYFCVFRNKINMYPLNEWNLNEWNLNEWNPGTFLILLVVTILVGDFSPTGYLKDKSVI